MNTIYYTETDLSNWELDYFKNRKKLSLFQWLEIFPEAIPYLKQKSSNLAQELKNKLIRNYELFGNDSWRGQLLRMDYIDRVGGQIKEIGKAFQKLYWKNNPQKAIPGRITYQQIEKARQANTQDLALQDLKKAKRIGNKVVGLCPVHNEQTPSFVVFKDGGFKCFGCQIAGSSAIDYQIKIKGLSFVEAVKSLN